MGEFRSDRRERRNGARMRGTPKSPTRAKARGTPKLFKTFKECMKMNAQMECSFSLPKHLFRRKL